MKAFVRRPVEIQPRQPSQAEQQESPEEKLPVANLLSRIAAQLGWGGRVLLRLHGFDRSYS